MQELTPLHETTAKLEARDGRPLRILHVTGALEAGGLSRYIYDLCSAMHARGHEVAVAGAPGAWGRPFELAPWPWIRSQTGLLPLTGWKTQRALRQYLADHPVDVLHTHIRPATLLARHLQKAALRGSRPANRIPILYTLHLSHMSMRWPRRMLTDFGDHTHVAAGQAQDWVMDEGRVPGERVTLIPHGIDPLRFPRAGAADRRAARQSLGITPGDRVAVFVGRLDYPKNVVWMLDFAAAAAAKWPDLRVLIVGDGPEKARLLRQAAARKLATHVRFLGHLDNPLEVYQAADALLLPSLREGFSFVTAEAMSVGVPVLRTNTSGSRELIVEGVTGRSVRIDHDAFVSGAMEFLSDREKLAEMCDAAAQHVREHFSFEKQITHTVDLYRRLASN